jgi:hypothetical protein
MAMRQRTFVLIRRRAVAAKAPATIPVRVAMAQWVSDTAKRLPWTMATRQAAVDSPMFSRNGVSFRFMKKPRQSTGGATAGGCHDRTESSTVETWAKVTQPSQSRSSILTNR